jgi:hypothetical protein
LREAVFVFRLECGENEFGQQTQIADIDFVEGEGPGGESFEDSDDASSSAEGNGDHGPRAELAARVKVDALIGLGIVADHDLRASEAGSRESRVAVNACAGIWTDAASGSA